MNYTELNTILSRSSFIIIDNESISNYTIRTDSVEWKDLKDILHRIGQILIEDTDRKLYIAAIMAGYQRSNMAMVAIALDIKKVLLSIYAKEGFIDQHTSEDVYKRIEKEIINIDLARRH